MLPEIPRALRAMMVMTITFAPFATPGAAQFKDARLPQQGRLWLELSPTLLNWSEQFAANPVDGPLADGDREPLFAHYDGPIAARLFPGPDVFIDELNTDAVALGYDPISTSDFSLGNLDFSSLRAQVRQLAVGFELGVLDRLSVGVRAPFTLTDISSSFVFDSTTATVTGGAAVFAPGGQFFTDAQSSLNSLQGLIDGGSLTGPALAEAMDLLADADAFVTALERRGTDDAFVPTAPSTAGLQMAQRFGELGAGFEGLGLSLPELLLPQTATAADLAALFRNSPLVAFQPRTTRNALDLGEVELSVRFGLIDQITRRVAEPGRNPDEPPSEPRPVPGDTTSGAGAASGDPASTALESPRAARGGIRLRTAFGVTARVPIRSASFPPFANAAHFLDLPIGDGQTDIELALYQDIAFNSWIDLHASARYGIQRPDDLILRVAPPDRPYAFESLQTVVHRDLGDYVLLLVRPSFRINSALSFSLEYDYFRLGDPSYSLVEALPDVADASPLEVEGGQTRQRVGVGFILDISSAQDRFELQSGARPVRGPWQFGISMRRAISGSGGQTPASFRFGADFRIPIRIF